MTVFMTFGHSLVRVLFVITILLLMGVGALFLEAAFAAPLLVVLGLGAVAARAATWVVPAEVQ